MSVCVQLVTILSWCSWLLAEIDKKNTLHSYINIRSFAYCLKKRQPNENKWVNILLIKHFINDATHHRCRFFFTQEERARERERKRKQRNSYRKHHPVLQRTIIITLAQEEQSNYISVLFQMRSLLIACVFLNR